MSRRIRLPGSLRAAFSARVAALRLLRDSSIADVDPERLASCAEEVRTTAKPLGQTPAALRYAQFASLLDCVVHLVRWGRAIRNAEADADRHRRAACQRGKDLANTLAADPEAEQIRDCTLEVASVEAVEDIEPAIRGLAALPLPLPMSREPEPISRPLANRQVREGQPEISVAFLRFGVDKEEFGEPHTVEPNVMHDLSTQIQVSRWPESAARLVLEPVTVEPPSTYELPRFELERPVGDAPYVLGAEGRMILRVPQSMLSRPLEFAYRASFEPEVSGLRVVVEGQRHLLMQSFDPAINPQSGREEVDRALLAIRQQVRGYPGVGDTELQDFLLLITELAKLACEAIQDDLFPGELTEAEFQKEVRRHMRRNPRIGSDLEEHPQASGGVTDLSFHRIRIELKVEPSQPVTLERAYEHLPQTSQYVVGSDRRFGVLCILDSTRKEEAPGRPEDDVHLVPFSPTGRAEGAPVLIGVIMVRGNLAKPSKLRGPRRG